MRPVSSTDGTNPTGQLPTSTAGTAVLVDPIVEEMMNFTVMPSNVDG
jgi:hypothetical protein